MYTIFLFFILMGLLYLLVKSAELVEGAFVSLARKIRVSEFFIGFVILSIVTSLPELSIAIVSSESDPELSAGNLLGATVILLTLVTGLSAIKYRELKFRGRFAEKEILMGIMLIYTMILVVLDRYVSVVEGVILASGYVLYIAYINHKFNKHFLAKHKSINVTKLYHSFGRAAVGVILLIVASSFVVRTAEALAIELQISSTLVGLILLAIGTNVPELTVLLTSGKKKTEENLALGNIFGSSCVNPGILGLLAILANGIDLVEFVSIVPIIIIMTFSVILFSIFSWTGKKLTSTEGILLLAAYASLLITETIILVGEL